MEWAGARCSSYVAEFYAIWWVIEVIVIGGEAAVPSGGVVLILCDCRSVVMAMSRGWRGAKRWIEVATFWGLRRLCDELGVHVVLQWVPGHCGLPGNEEADVMAKSLQKSGIPCPLGVVADVHQARALVDRHLRCE